MQFSYVIEDDFQRDAVFWWSNDQYFPGDILDASGVVDDDRYDSGTLVEQHMVGFFPEGSGTITLTQIGTNEGDTVSGTISFTGYAYDADIAVN